MDDKNLGKKRLSTHHLWVMKRDWEIPSGGNVGVLSTRDLDKSWRERLVKNHLDLIILRLLKTKPRWGYEVNLEIRDRFKVYLSAGTLYPLLHNMEEKGYLQAVWEAEGGRGRKVYRITPRGEEFLSAGSRVAEEFLKRIQYAEAEVTFPQQSPTGQHSTKHV